MVNSVDTDEVAHLNLRCLQFQLFSVFSNVNIEISCSECFHWQEMFSKLISKER